MNEALAKLKARIKYLEAQQANRWAAFTDDEIHEMLRAVPDDDKPFWHEVRAEQVARAALRSKPA